RNLRRALELLAQHGKLTLPKQASRWDHSAQPALPRFVVLTTAARKPAPARQHVAWAPELSFARELRSPEQRDLLLCVQRFLASGGRTRPLVPERERSLQLFGDEKRLEKLRRTQLFGPDRLSLGLLRCFSVSPPLVWQGLETRSRTAIVLENHHSYHSFCTFAARTGRYAAVAYGAGKALLRSAASLDQLVQELGIERFVYLGDLDATGLRIARAADEALRKLGLGRLEPSGHYRALLEYPSQPDATPESVAPHDLEWLPAELRERARQGIAAGRRWPQEHIGTEHLLDARADDFP
ncbi:MAG: DUF2220 domain-containing protein, partial [Proteobacteria bacterium]|nr:DUF2220 domain-containing protein [Pseudomonadota bacterium]